MNQAVVSVWQVQDGVKPGKAMSRVLLSKLALSLEHQTCVSKASGSLGPRLSEQCGLQTLLLL